MHVVRWFVGSLVGSFVGWLVGSFVRSFVGWLAVWVAGWVVDVVVKLVPGLVGWRSLIGWLVGWLTGWFSFECQVWLVGSSWLAGTRWLASTRVGPAMSTYVSVPHQRSIILRSVSPRLCRHGGERTFVAYFSVNLGRFAQVECDRCLLQYVVAAQAVHRERSVSECCSSCTWRH